MLQIRPYTPADHAFVLSLAPRLLIGKQLWCDDQRWLQAVEGWLTGSMEQHNQKTIVFVAHTEQGEQLGFATVSQRKHFTGQPQAAIGELATREEAEGHGVGSALVAACEQWGREQGYMLITLP